MGEGLETVLDLMPDPPTISDETYEKCRESGDFREILFEYYKYVAIICVICSQTVFESPALQISRKKWTVLVGLLTRCQRIMAAHLEYFQDGRYGDVTFILDRCLLETCIKVRWISGDPAEIRLQRYFEDSLRTDKELLDEIKRNVVTRNNVELVFERRMLASIARNAKEAGINIADLAAMRRAPPLSAMMEEIGEDRFLYTVVGKIASHAVHGSWANLLHSYLDEDENGNLVPASTFPNSHINQYVINCLFVIDACVDFLKKNFSDADEIIYILAIIENYQREIWELNLEIVGEDFSHN